MKIELFLAVIILYCVVPLNFFALDQKSLPIVESQPLKQPAIKDVKRRLNTVDTFKNTINQETYVFMAGNNLYFPYTNFSNLNYCIDDCRLLKSILTRCCNIKEANIFIYENLKIDEFKINFMNFVKSKNKDCRIIIYYSGHGTKDGSLLFVDGQKLYPVELRAYIDSFGNDTFLILDTCYSGNNDGPLEIVEWPFRISCQRIYASLSHQTAKEITYENTPYFKSILPFYHDVLHVDNIKGNSYFIAMLGLFFATYNLGKAENISFSDIVSYVTKESNNYMEYLSQKSIDEPKVLAEINQRAYQVPKIEPWYKDLHFKMEDHCFIIYQDKEKNFTPKSNYLSLGYQIAAMIPVSDLKNFIYTGISTGTGLSYNLFQKWGILGFGISTGLCYTSSLEGVSIPYKLLINPVSFDFVYITNFPLPMYLLTNISLGFAFYHFNYTDQAINVEPGMNFFLSPAMGIGFYLTKKISILISCHYTMTFLEDAYTHAITPEIGVFYYFLKK